VYISTGTRGIGTRLKMAGPADRRSPPRYSPISPIGSAEAEALLDPNTNVFGEADQDDAMDAGDVYVPSDRKLGARPRESQGIPKREQVAGCSTAQAEQEHAHRSEYNTRRGYADRAREKAERGACKAIAHDVQ